MTHFQYLTWTSLGAPPSATPLLEFRRKVNKACSNPKTPLLVHCSGGVGRTGTYMLIDMALSRIQSGGWGHRGDLWEEVWLFVVGGCGFIWWFSCLISAGAKEINLAASVEHLRDHRPHMVKTKVCVCVSESESSTNSPCSSHLQLQFEFALSALVEETHAMLDAARQRAMH